MALKVRRVDLLFVLGMGAVVVGIALLPSPIDSNPMIPANNTHQSVKNEKECLLCHSSEGIYPFPDRHLTKRQDCFNCHGKQ
jgi:hypothetical protein